MRWRGEAATHGAKARGMARRGAAAQGGVAWLGTRREGQEAVQPIVFVLASVTMTDQLCYTAAVRGVEEEEDIVISRKAQKSKERKNKGEQ
ncbi:hypothetical protein GUJ93_ZPchr0004g38770 [Zizania palustris]|uniref:Uncharacterized protein n=1 Tax=Zizania palustris TaxID=103762 RepID=A0A8J5VZ16_ZIZPA|nr:hypothetical protein GUJ93_ZPchr0004g38770 [Zizania palustris]